MSRATMKSKYRILRGFRNKHKAEKWGAGMEGVEIIERRWTGRDKRRYYVRQLIRRGTKR